ncbi:MAG: aromatic amino acid lyase [Candidatus Odinarchaeota archaeon]
MKNKELVLDGSSLDITTIVNTSFSPTKISISDESWKKINKSYDFFNKIFISNTACYGVNTNLGALIDFNISNNFESDFQNQIINTHAVGWGSKFGIHISKAILLLRLNCFAKGASGISPNLVKLMITLYNNDAIPEIYTTGSLGASGDLAPLSHLAAFINGQGNGYLKGELISAKEIFKKLKIKPIILKRKEGLSLINGTSAMTAVGAFALYSLKKYFKLMLIGMSMLMESNEISNSFIYNKAFKLKSYEGSNRIVDYLNEIIQLSSEHYTNQNLQPVYSFRCVPFILSELYENIIRTENKLVIESNSVNDNPIYIEEYEKPYHGGHFHGHVISVSMDSLRIATAHLTGVIDRQLEYIMNGSNNNISPFLSLDPSKGFCGLEGLQYLATSLHIENVHLSNSYSINTLPTNSGNQDYVSLGLQSSLATLKMVENIKGVLAIYFTTSVQAYALRKIQPKNIVHKYIYDSINSIYKFPYSDNRILSEIISEIGDDKIYEEWLTIANKYINAKIL